MIRFLVVCLGGAVGTGARYLLSGAMARALGPAFPFGTLSVNLLGSFLITLIMHVGLASTLISPALRIVLTTGVLGGFTTYSSFSYETLRFLQDGAWGLALANVAATVLGCLAASVLGLGLGRLLVGA
jgi:CrcB protein